MRFHSQTKHLSHSDCVENNFGRDAWLVDEMKGSAAARSSSAVLRALTLQQVRTHCVSHVAHFMVSVSSLLCAREQCTILQTELIAERPYVQLAEGKAVKGISNR